jgi:hypothetical protein
LLNCLITFRDASAGGVKLVRSSDFFEAPEVFCDDFWLDWYGIFAAA